ncbi:hypothetical protein L6E12_12640 [Actinokineospora sp. PR83]|uniref:hypothetical protein n=1 Tax=Actinokineospora sp. PR83 TaxID=2884908 RepID=UPI001F216961|nr:hypothetical protein [Actinokineospora sp. PR83]MCG8916638.1 hypothetical protein [Actinokineospora sp. PR83]
MTVGIEQNPLFRIAQARFEESRYARRAETARIDAEFAARAERLAAEKAGRDEQFAALLDRAKAMTQRKPEPEQGKWVPKASRQVVMTFGDEELQAEAATRTRPIPVQSAPQQQPLPSLPPTAPIPVPEPVREPQPPRYLSFGGEEDEAEAAPPPPVQRRPVRPSRPAEPDDDDLSGHTWMR